MTFLRISRLQRHLQRCYADRPTFLDTSSLNDPNKHFTATKRFLNKSLQALNAYARRPITFEQVQNRKHNFTHPLGHPKIQIFKMEQNFVNSLLDVQERPGAITESDLTLLYKQAIDEFEDECLPRQMIVEMLSSFLSIYDSEWVKREVIPLIPATAKSVGHCSDMVLVLCIAAYKFTPDQVLSREVDKFVCKIYEELQSRKVKAEDFSFNLVCLWGDLEHTLCGSSK